MSEQTAKQTENLPDGESDRTKLSQFPYAEQIKYSQLIESVMVVDKKN